VVKQLEGFGAPMSRNRNDGCAAGPLVSLRGITKTYDLGTGALLAALESISVEIPDKQFVSVIGPSGCGKSTLLSIIAGLLEPSSGDVQIAGRPPAAARAAHELGMVFQQPVLLPWRTVRANCRLLPEVARIASNEIEARIDELLELVGLTEFADRYPNQLSGGMRQRAAIARALCLDPLLMLMDEPFGALDEFTRHLMNVELLKVWAQRQKTIVFVTHNIAEAVFLSDRVLAMCSRPGRILDDVAITLPRPRHSEIRYTKEFTDLVVHTQMLLEKALPRG
jgi:NitT/TauT family transport system ATP-binding protein